MATAPWEVTREMFLSEAEVDRLTRHLADRAADPDDVAAQVDRLVIAGLLYSGLRNSEFCGLRVADTIVGTGESVFVVHGTPRQDRTVHVPRHVSELVRKYVQHIRPCLTTHKTRDRSQPLILNERGRAYERTGLYRRVVKILTAAGLGERASVQLLRHTYGYLAYRRTGGNLLFIQQQMGHAHPMVSSVYAKFVDEDYAALANRIACDVPVQPEVPTRKPRQGGKR